MLIDYVFLRNLHRTCKNAIFRFGELVLLNLDSTEFYLLRKLNERMKGFPLLWLVQIKHSYVCFILFLVLSIEYKKVSSWKKGVFRSESVPKKKSNSSNKTKLFRSTSIIYTFLRWKPIKLLTKKMPKYPL